ncbi:universal stress protein [Desulfomonile tiedjei]|uniref:Universal stress protein UspA-like protein n=1 Tax=Desulfomonile tiedjei (strain ATCC 49306 / DSM 6799 / DCB-1) TaxID=706587 RepID=I4C5D2_DESTA|nr:universal stress protein [Desulfomonile tiedjei]AFM24773.1 universal stress protein UspA-like protein [Desulfomonile tiedjei DSM 6799]
MLPKKILFCTDFSENSEPARQLAVDYAKAFGANLLITHVIDSSGFPNYVDWVGEELGQILNRTEETANARLKSLSKECEPITGGVRTFCRIGLPSQEIVSLADEKAVDLIVVGTHGRTGVKHLVMGSIARSVLKTAHRPVLIVEAPSGKGESSERPHEIPVPTIRSC